MINLKIGSVFTGLTEKTFKGRIQVVAINKEKDLLRVSLTLRQFSNNEETFLEWKENWSFKNIEERINKEECYLLCNPASFENYPIIEVFNKN